MSDGLELADAQVAADLTTYVARARTLDADGAIRLQASGSTLAAWVGVRKGRGLMGEGTVIGLRVLPLARAVDEPVDVVVPLAAVADRLARSGSPQGAVPNTAPGASPQVVDESDGAFTLEIPPMTVRTSWAAVTPPRSGWSPLARLPVDGLVHVARVGIEEVATGTPEGAGAAAVEQLRERVWNRPIEGDLGGADGLPTGAALGLYALGFAVGDVATVYGTARWHRVSTDVGHVLVR
ncbi:hypothetical protein [Dermacoccus nishinomiyaensis]|uniref:hypothetical protein n=1 Tax=Dermacoccus nishinomiyaensis TaxID=1274 RepID=UPI0011A230EB|nr:hypothetical protein [Dermacoccus nishinomiyaensis]